MKKILQRASSIRLERLLGFLALTSGVTSGVASTVGCGSSEVSTNAPGMFTPAAPVPAVNAPPSTPALPQPTPTNVGTMEGTPSDVPLDGNPVGEAPAAMEGMGPVALDPETTPEPSQFDPGPDGVQPVTPNASPEARNLLGFLYQEYGVHMISGQMESTWTRGGADAEIDYVEQVTGKVPALRGLDFITYDGVAQRAIEWWERGGIVDIRWHWGAPTHGQGYDASQEAVDIDTVLTPGTPEYQSMMDGLDRTAEELAIIRDANVPVLWTPFHELNGNWFWWGKEGPDQFIRLWRFMFDYYTQEKGLTNLIWVLGYTGNPDGDWYPGKEYVDIGGADSYGRGDDPRLNMFNGVRNIVGNEMPVAYHENGIIPSAALARQQGATWSWFMTWHTSWITTNNTQAHIQEVYADDFVLTLDEMPNLR